MTIIRPYEQHLDIRYIDGIDLLVSLTNNTIYLRQLYRWHRFIGHSHKQHDLFARLEEVAIASVQGVVAIGESTSVAMALAADFAATMTTHVVVVATGDLACAAPVLARSAAASLWMQNK